MSRVHGVGLEGQWASMSWFKKELVVQQVIIYLTQLFRKRFARLGSLYTSTDLQALSTAQIPDATLLGADYSTENTAFCLSQVVLIPFFYGNHITFDAPRGPFRNSLEWLASELQLHLLEADTPFNPPH